MALCESDRDCLPTETNTLCYANLSKTFETDPLGCACNTFYGWGKFKYEHLNLPHNSDIQLAMTVVSSHSQVRIRISYFFTKN